MSIMESVKQSLICAEIIRNPENIKNYSLQTYSMQMFAVRHSAESLKWIDTPYPQVIEAAIKLNPKQIQYVKDQYLYANIALEITSFAISYLKPETISMLSEETLLKVINDNAEYIKYIKKPSFKLMVTAIGINPNVVSYFDSLSEDLQLLAVNLDPAVIGKIKKPTTKAICKSIHKLGKIDITIDKKYINHDIALYAVRHNPNIYYSLPSELMDDNDIKNHMIEYHKHVLDELTGVEE